MPPVKDSHLTDIKQVPQNETVRELIRQRGAELAGQFDPHRPPRREDLERVSQELLAESALPRGFMGFAMVALNNGFWRNSFEAVPFRRRLLLLPHCLREPSICGGQYDSVGLHCAGCGACSLSVFKNQAEELGYAVIVAEGTAAVAAQILEGRVDALLGVACLDSLDKSFARISELGVPTMAVPLLNDGCHRTTVEREQVLLLLEAQSEPAGPPSATRLPLLLETARMFEERSLTELLASCLHPTASILNPLDPLKATQSIALDWVRRGGKRLRPFVTLATYAAAKHGATVFGPATDFGQLLPPAVRCVAVAVEVLHKASLVHDDIEDDDKFRYGRLTLYRDYGLAPAINIGDYLVGLGYRLISAQTNSLGAECVADLLKHFTTAHLELCRGQGAELFHHRESTAALSSLDVLAMYNLKTSPAFEVAIDAGMRAAGVPINDRLLKRFCLYLGEGYQILNDLDDWQGGAGNEASLGRDALAKHPTILRAFALEAGCGDMLAELLQMDSVAENPAMVVAGVRDLYAEIGAFAQAEILLNRLHERAMRLAARAKPASMRELMAFLVRLIIPRKTIL